MKTKMIFSIAALLMLGSICMNAQENSNGSTSNDYSKQPFTIVPIEKDLDVLVLGDCGPMTCSSVKMYHSYDLGQTWDMIIADGTWFRVKVGQKISFKIENHSGSCSNGIVVKNVNSEDTKVGKFYVEGDLGTMRHLDRMSGCRGKGFFSGMTSLVSAENLIIPDDYSCENMFSGCTSLTTAPVLSASTLTENRYKNMFNGCSKLNFIKCLATDISASGCTEGWLDGVSSSGTFVKASSMNSWPSGASGIPSGWTVTNAQNTQTKRTIHVATAGTLPNLISEEEKYQIEELTLSGELNGTDFKFIREMAGKASHFTEDTNFGSHIEWASFRNTGGKLSVIDMSGVNIISGGIYLTIYEEWTIPNVKEYIVQANEIPFFVFGGCGLTSITIPNSVTSIGIKAFCNCSGLTSIVSQIKNPFEISDDVFDSEIYSTATLTVPFGTKSIYETTNGWKNFQNIVEAPSFKRTIHVATAGTLSDLISADEKYKIEELTLTGELNGTDFKFIREMAGDVVSSKNVPTKINKYPNLIVCHNPTDGILTSLDISNTEIVEGGENYNYIRDMNHGISGLSTIDNKITPGLFSQTNLKSIILPNSITSIEGKQYGYMYFTDEPGDYEQYEEKYISAFPQSLTSITIPNSVTSIDNGVFYGTAWYNNQPDGLVYAGKIAYKYKGEMPANTQITIKDGTLGIAGSALYNCSGLTSITIPNSVTSIGNSSLSGCSGLTSITIPNSVTSIGNEAFYNCSGLTSITIPNSVTSIGNKAFYNCSGLTSITIPNSVTSIGTYAFSGTIWYNNQPDGLVYAGKIAYKYKGKMPANTSVIIKDGTLGITGEAFSGCSGLTSITIPNSMTSIGSFAFYECSGLTSITIPNSVTSIERGAFSYCSGLTKVVSKIKNPFIIPYVFSSDIFSNAELIVPAGTKSLYEATEDWNKFSKITEHLPTLETQPAQPTSTTKARLIALANEEDDDQHFGFEWLRNDAPANMPANKVSAPLYDGRIIGSLGGLNPDIYYKYRPFYKSDAGEMVYGEWVPFLTGDANVFFEPEVHTKDAVVSNDGALLSAVFVEGTEDIQEKGFEYWQKNSNARAVSLTRGNNIGSVIVSGNNTSVTIEGLKAGTEYGYRSYVKTASGITYGEEKTFKTSMFGDVNGDNKVDSNDLNDLVSYIIGNSLIHFNKDAADLNNDKKVNAADIVKMVKILK